MPFPVPVPVPVPVPIPVPIPDSGFRLFQTPLSQTFRPEIWLKFSEFFDNIPLRILLDVLFRVFRFSKTSFYALASSFMTF